MSFAGVVLAGTLGSYVGSIANYYVARWIGLPLITRYGKYAGISPGKLAAAQDWVKRYGTPGIFLARLLPVVRHLISIPAGILRMPIAGFSLATATGAALWCFVLSWFGAEVIGSHPELLQSPEAMVSVIKAKLAWFVLAVVALLVMYLMTHRKLRSFAPSS
jgi:membrane protein DedA with SNARE-associated domain